MAEQILHSVNIGIGIVSVLERYERAKKLRETIGVGSIVVDTNRNGSWFGTKEAWKLCSKEYTHFLVIEEDVLVCKDFYETITNAVSAVPDQLISFFNLRSDKRLNEWAVKNDSHWATLSAGTTGQAVLMPREMVYQFLLWESKYINPKIPYEDTRLWAFMKKFSYKTFVTVPNVCEHGGALTSALGFNNKGKVSYDFIGENVSGKDIDWTKGIEKASAHSFANDWLGWSQWFDGSKSFD